MQAKHTKIPGIIGTVLSNHPDIQLAFLFGSMARDFFRNDSDFDLAISGDSPVSSHTKMTLIEELALASGRPVDLVDLQNAPPVVLQQVLKTGEMILCRNRRLYGELIRRVAYDDADYMPYYRRILAARRQQWIGS